MSETKFTPGPWFAGQMHRWSGTCITRRPPIEYGPSGTIGDAPIAQVVAKAPHWENSYPVDANAALIAAAPDLYAALEDLRSSLIVLTKNSDLTEELKQADAALAKARGES